MTCTVKPAFTTRGWHGSQGMREVIFYPTQTESHHGIGISASCADSPATPHSPASLRHIRVFRRSARIWLIYLITRYIIRTDLKHTHSLPDRPQPTNGTDAVSIISGNAYVCKCQQRGCVCVSVSLCLDRDVLYSLHAWLTVRAGSEKGLMCVFLIVWRIGRLPSSLWLLTKPLFTLLLFQLAQSALSAFFSQKLHTCRCESRKMFLYAMKNENKGNDSLSGCKVYNSGFSEDRLHNQTGLSI